MKLPSTEEILKARILSHAAMRLWPNAVVIAKRNQFVLKRNGQPDEPFGTAEECFGRLCRHKTDNLIVKI